MVRPCGEPTGHLTCRAVYPAEVPTDAHASAVGMAQVVSTSSFFHSHHLTDLNSAYLCSEVSAVDMPK